MTSSKMFDTTNTSSSSSSSSKLFEFQVIILAGGDGSLLYPLLDKKQPKSLLPVCNRPLLYYQLRLLEKVGFGDVIVATDEQYRAAFTHYLSTYASEGGKIRVELFHPTAMVGDGMENEEYGTAETLRQMRGRIRGSFIVLAGDLVTEASLYEIADLHRMRDATVTMLLKEQEPAGGDEDNKKSSATSTSGAVPFKANTDSVRVFVGLDETSRVVLMKASEKEDGGMSVSRQLLGVVPRFELRTDLADAHLYIFKNWILDLIQEKKFSSLRNDVVEYLVSIQFRKDIKTELGSHIWTSSKSSQHLAHLTTSQPWEAPGDVDRVRVFAYVSGFNKTGGLFTARANTVGAYAMVNFALLEQPIGTSTPWEPFVSAPIKSRVDEQPPPSVSGGDGPLFKPKSKEITKSLLGVNCIIHPTANVHRCILGEGCVVGANVRLSNSLLLDGCKIDDGAQVLSCLLGAGAHVGRKCVLNNARVQPKFVVPDETLHKFDKGQGELVVEDDDDEDAGGGGGDNE